MKQPQAKLSRRNFLFAATAGTAATAAVVVGIKKQSPAESKKEGAASTSGYQLTEHVRNYYRTAKI